MEALLANIRPQDVAECDALLGPGQVATALRDSIEQSSLLWTLTFDGEVGGIFGVASVSLMSGRGAPWLIGTPLIDRHRGAFIKLCKVHIPRMLAAFPLLINVIDVRNVKSIAWLKRAGFEILAPIPLGPEGMPFHPFFMEA